MSGAAIAAAGSPPPCRWGWVRRGGGAAASRPPPAPRQRCLAAWANQRRQRDPANYQSMDELRSELERGDSGDGLVTGLIKWLGAAANTASSAASPLQAAYQWLLRKGAMPSKRESLDPDDDSDLDPQAMRELQALLLVGRTSVARMIRRCPQVLAMERGELIARLVGMKALFPGSDVARMVELAPAAFLDGDWPPKAQQLEAASTLLRRELSGADLDFMFQEDPAILFEPVDSLQVGLRRMRELWPGLTPQALGDSEPLHLSLAVKALGLSGPPKGF